ncbi:MAG: hypothetical protein AAF970_14985, partial [Bacteroidota bacterium]
MIYLVATPRPTIYGTTDHLKRAATALTALPSLWRRTGLKARQALCSSVWPGKLYSDGQKTRTVKPSEITALFEPKMHKKQTASPVDETGGRSGSPGRTRTYNPAVNSRMLYH